MMTLNHFRSFLHGLLLLAISGCLAVSCTRHKTTYVGENEDETVVQEQVLTEENSFTCEAISDSLLARMRGNSLPEDVSNLEISLDDLRYLKLLYYDFSGQVKEGEMVCNKLIAADLIYIFRELYHAQYQIESIRLTDDFGGSDEASMEADNTSCFNYRKATGLKTLSKHAMGLAVDINPLYNPYVRDGRPVQPASGAAYADRSQDFPHKLSKEDLCWQLFHSRGFSWGGTWTRLKDYQHFEK